MPGDLVYTILIVDDDTSFLRSLSFGLFRASTHRILVAWNGVEGLQLLERGEVDCVVTDLSMPELGGIEFIEKVREKDRDIPIIVMSSYWCRDYGASLEELGVFAILEKPICIDSFEAEITRALVSRGKIPSAATNGRRTFTSS